MQFFDLLRKLTQPNKPRPVGLGGIFKTRGIFEIKAYDLDGREVYHDVQNNLIVDLGYDTMLQVLATAGANKHVTKIGFGVGTSPAVPGDTTLTTGFIKPLDGFSYPAFNKVQFLWALEYGEYNGNDVTEFSLFSDNGVDMFSRVVRPAISKVPTLRLEGTWTIIF
jgi:hypothetical protein